MATTEQMKHEYVIQYPAVTKDVAFDKTITWIAQNFKSAKSVIDYQDKAAGTIVVKGIIQNVSVNSTMGGAYTRQLAFTLTMDVRDEKARLNFSVNEDNTLQIHEAATREFQKLTDGISEAIKSKSW